MSFEEYIKSNNVVSYAVRLPHGEFHYATRATVPKTDLWLFGCGMGEENIIVQMAAGFLRYVEARGDPESGKVVIAVGVGESALAPHKGDVNLYMAENTGGSEDWLEKYLKHTQVKPDIILCISHACLEYVEKKGYEAMYFPFAADPQLFQPLNARREGLGYAGLDSTKSPQQVHIILELLLQRSDFEWIGKKRQDIDIFHLNEWLNTKKIVYGMSSEMNEDYGMVGNRLFETLASGTPFICSHRRSIDEVLGFDYPFLSKAREDTVRLTEQILSDYDAYLKVFKGYSDYVRREHTYLKRFEVLFDHLDSR